MPQMSPLNWLSLMILFAAILILFNISNYFSIQYQITQKTSSLPMPKINWKW